MVESSEATAPAPSADATKKDNKFLKYLKIVWDLILEHWFILGLGFAIGFAAAVPDFGRKGGWIAAQWTIKYGAVIIIFFLSGCSLKTKALLTVMARIHVHLFIQFICLVLTPAIGYGIARALMESSMDSDLVDGLVVAMVMPTTISTNVVFTKQAGGNEAAALVNAVIGNIIGIFISPAWLYLYLGKSGHAPYSDVIRQLAITIIAPLIVGQLVQYFFPTYVKKAQEKVNTGKIGNLMIILLVWSTFCDTFYKDIHVEAGSWVPMLFLEIGMFLSFSVMCFLLATFVPFKQLFSLDKPDAVAIVMCGSTKTLALGMPLISVLYGKNANAGVLSLPLIIYHATQCLLGSLYLKQLKGWVKGPSPGAWPASCWRPEAEAQLGDEGAKALTAGDSSSAPTPTGAGGKGETDGDFGGGGSSGESSGATTDAIDGQRGDVEAGAAVADAEVSGTGAAALASTAERDGGRLVPGVRAVDEGARAALILELDPEKGEGAGLATGRDAGSAGSTALPGSLPRVR